MQPVYRRRNNNKEENKKKKEEEQWITSTRPRALKSEAEQINNEVPCGGAHNIMRLYSFGFGNLQSTKSQKKLWIPGSLGCVQHSFGARSK